MYIGYLYVSVFSFEMISYNSVESGCLALDIGMRHLYSNIGIFPNYNVMHAKRWVRVSLIFLRNISLMLIWDSYFLVWLRPHRGGSLDRSLVRAQAAYYSIAKTYFI